MDPLTIAKDFVLPALGTLGGGVLAALHYKMRLENLEKDFSEYKKGHKEKHEEDIKGTRERLLEIDREIDRVEAQTRAELQKKYDELRSTVDELDEAFNRFERASNHDFAKDAELSSFIEDQNKQWQAIHRLLGQIEGLLKRPSSWPQSPQLPPPRPGRPTRNSG